MRRAADVLLAATAITIPLSTTGMQVGVGGLAALAVASVPAGWGIVRRTPLDGALLLFFGVLALSTLASGHPLAATGWARPWVVLGYFVVFWWLRDGKHAARFVRLLVLAASVTAVYAIVQHYTGADWYRVLLGRQKLVRVRDAESTGFAVVGFFANYLTFAHAMLFPLAWATALAVRGFVVGIVGGPAIALALVFSTARGAWLAAVVAAVATALLDRGRLAALVVAGLFVAAAAGFALAPELRGHAAAMFSSGGENAGRVGIYRANLDIIHDHPVLGLGFGRYRAAATPYYDAHPEADRRSHAHSNYLQIAAEAGLVGLAAFGFLFATVLRVGWRAIVRAPDAAAWATAAGAWVGVLAFLVGGVTQYSFGDNEVALAMWTTVAILMRTAES